MHSTVQSPAHAPRAERPREKRAEQIASAIEADVLAGRWPIGTRLGNEAKLAEAYGVSRWTMREASAILEQTGTLVVRSGNKGGLFVAAPGGDLVRNSLGTYIETTHMPFDAVIEVRVALAMIAIPASMANLSPADREALAGFILRADNPGVDAIEAASAARNLLWERTGSRSLALFLETLADVGLHSCWMSALDDGTFVKLVDRLAANTKRHCLAILANDPQAAMKAEVEQLAVSAEIYAASGASGRTRRAENAVERVYALYPSSRPKKKADQVAWAIRQKITEEHLEPGVNLGSEASLMTLHQVGRPVLREAIRMVERLGLVTMRPGTAGGLTVTAPDPERVTQLAREYLRRDLAEDALTRQISGKLRALASANPVASFMLSILAD